MTKDIASWDRRIRCHDRGGRLLDVDDLDGQGLAVIGRIRKHAAIPVIALSARTTEGAGAAARREDQAIRLTIIAGRIVKRSSEF